MTTYNHLRIGEGRSLPYHCPQEAILEPFIWKFYEFKFIFLGYIFLWMKSLNSHGLLHIGLAIVDNTYAAAVGNVCRSRSFFLTTEGCMGLAPPGAKETDMLCRVLGCEMSLVVRPSGRKYSLVGSCYIYGMMKGE